ncbi:MAG: hypothetical protein H6993_04830 [Pseudomonadales bacterium]|nr:hypothetical protein [Pseudomonadales bacterium]MCP5183263.1 hypothetical protein [Pseudomonadales bacterium]
MILESLDIGRSAFEQGTGWQLKPEGACKGEVCIPLPSPPGDEVHVESLAAAMGLPLVKAGEQALWALGPEHVSGHALTTADAPDLCLPDLNGNPFHLSSLRGRKVLLYAWAPY